MDGQPSIYFEKEYNDGNIFVNIDESDNLQQVIEEETGTKLEKRLCAYRMEFSGLFELYMNSS